MISNKGHKIVGILLYRELESELFAREDKQRI